MRLVFPGVGGCILLLSSGIASAMTCTVYCPDGSTPSMDCDANYDPCASSSGSGNASPGHDDGAARRAQEAAEQQRQAEAARVQRERDARFIRDRDAAAATLKGSGGAMSQLKGLSGADNSGLKGSGFDTGRRGSKELRGAERETRAQPTPAAPPGDPKVVDARKVPSGLPKGVDRAIADAYASAPPGVSDRVRKGFQAVMDRDWKVAKAWFQEALNRDPGNAALERLVALSDPSQQTRAQRSPVDARNEPAGLGGKPGAKRANPDLQLPDPNDMHWMFPGLDAMRVGEPPVFKTMPDGTRVQLPRESDVEFLFGPAPPPHH